MSRAAYVETELGLERVCSGCGESWPYDREFWYRQPNGHLGLQSLCKACKFERRGTRYRRADVDVERVRMLIGSGIEPREVARRLGCSPRTVLRHVDNFGG